MLWKQDDRLTIMRDNRYGYPDRHAYLGRIHCGFIRYDRKYGEGTNRFVWGLPVAKAHTLLKEGDMELQGLIASLRVKPMYEEAGKSGNPLNSTYLVTASGNEAVVFGTINLDRGWRETRPERLYFLLSDGIIEPSGMLLGTQLMCLDREIGMGGQLTSYYTRVNTMRCRVSMRKMKIARARVRHFRFS